MHNVGIYHEMQQREGAMAASKKTINQGAQGNKPENVLHTHKRVQTAEGKLRALKKTVIQNKKQKKPEE